MKPTLLERALAWIQSLPDLILAAIFFVVPVAILLAYSFGQQDPLTRDVSITGTVRAYRLLFSDLYRPVFVRSIELSTATLVLCVGIGVPAAIAITRMAPQRQKWALVAILLPSFVSFTVRIYAWVGLLGNSGPVADVTRRLTGEPVVLLFRPGSLLIGMVTAYVPLFILPVLSSMQRIEDIQLDVAADLGARPFRVTRKVTIPLSMPGIIAGAAIVGILSLGEFLIPTILGGGKVLLLGTLLAEQAGGRNKPLGGAIAATMIVAMIIIAVVAGVARRSIERRHG